MNARILIVDDEADVLELLSLDLGKEGYIIQRAQSGSEALSSIRTNRPDLILLDIMLPDMSGVQLTGKLKNSPETADIPIILLTAKDSETDMVVGLSVGADDYVTKPFSPAVLIARIEAVLRRAQSEIDDGRETYSAGPLKVVPANRQVFVEGKSVELTGGEYGILLALVKAGGAVLSREELRGVLGEGAHGESERIVDVHVAALRKKLGDCRRLVKTVHGRGYRVEI
jgi:two-component system phosphate regulon response regulator PhoB